jgi:hypothetical protein
MVLKNRKYRHTDKDILNNIVIPLMPPEPVMEFPDILSICFVLCTFAVPLR